MAIRLQDRPPPKTEPNPDEFLTVEQVAHALKSSRTRRAWIHSGALVASRPGNGTRPGRKSRVRRADLATFVAASQRPLASP